MALHQRADRRYMNIDYWRALVNEDSDIVPDELGPRRDRMCLMMIEARSACVMDEMEQLRACGLSPAMRVIATRLGLEEN